MESGARLPLKSFGSDYLNHPELRKLGETQVYSRIWHATRAAQDLTLGVQRA